MQAEASGYVCQATRDEAGLIALLTAQFAERAYVLIRKTATVDLLAFEADALERLVPGSEGQAFNRDLEIRWRPDGAGYAVLTLTEDESRVPTGFTPLSEATYLALKALGRPVAPLTETGEANEASRSAQGDPGLYLWGTRRTADAVWQEARIPRPLVYPVSTSAKRASESAPPPRLMHRLYRERQSQATRWIRLCALEEER